MKLKSTIRRIESPAGRMKILILHPEKQEKPVPGILWIHGGGFAGTTLNFVPQDLTEKFVNVMEQAFGEGACSVLNIRPVGAARVVV